MLRGTYTDEFHYRLSDMSYRQGSVCKLYFIR